MTSRAGGGPPPGPLPRDLLAALALDAARRDASAAPRFQVTAITFDGHRRVHGVIAVASGACLQFIRSVVTAPELAPPGTDEIVVLPRAALKALYREARKARDTEGGGPVWHCLDWIRTILISREDR